MAERDPCERLEMFFGYDHLRPELQDLGELFAMIYRRLLTMCPHNQELTLSLRELNLARKYAMDSLVPSFMSQQGQQGGQQGTPV